MKNHSTNSDLVDLLIKWWKQLLGVAVIALVLSSIFSSSLFIAPKYKSFAVLYPANIIPMGTETATEQMLQVLHSDVIRDSIAELYHLYQAYNINPDSRTARSTLMECYQENVDFRRTEFESVIIEVLDKDPVQAHDMVRSIIYFFNAKQRSLQKEKAQEVVKILSDQLALKKTEMDNMEAVLLGIRQDYGILDYSLQTEYVTERYLEVISSPGKKERVKEIEPLLSALKEKGGEFMALNEHLWRIRGSYNDLKEQLEAAQRDVDKNLTYSNVITNPVVADKKSYPIRWLIVAVSVLAAVLLSLLVLGFKENIDRSRTN